MDGEWTLIETKVKRKGSLDYALDHDYVVVNTARVPTTRTPKNTTERPSALCTTQTPATKFLELKEFPRKRSRENTKMFRDREQKNKRAVMILDNYQLLCKYAEANGKTVAQTRMYFRKVACGLDAEPIIENWLNDDDKA